MRKRNYIILFLMLVVALFENKLLFASDEISGYVSEDESCKYNSVFFEVIVNENNTKEIIVRFKSDDNKASSCPSCRVLRFCFPERICAGLPMVVENGSSGCVNNPVFEWDFGDDSPLTQSLTHTYANSGNYTITLSIQANGDCPVSSVTTQITVSNCEERPCNDCISSFSPEPGKKYLISAWVKEENASVTKTSYDNPQLFVVFPNLDSATTTLGPLTAKGDIIDGWQRVEDVFDIPTGATEIRVRLFSLSGNSYFDDIRIFPFDATMKSYVYDPINLRLVSELDERNYATFYEYDEEGKLVRVKKETERGIMTIKESKDNTVKQ